LRIHRNKRIQKKCSRSPIKSIAEEKKPNPETAEQQPHSSHAGGVSGPWIEHLNTGQPMCHTVSPGCLTQPEKIRSAFCK